MGDRTVRPRRPARSRTVPEIASRVPVSPGARQGINPFTGEETVFKAKPATVKVKVRPVKKLKDAATA
jgi:hypothetical protein